jgi:hypothetical protein
MVQDHDSVPDSAWGWPIQHRQSHIPRTQLENMRTQADTLADECFRALIVQYPQLLTCTADGLLTALKAEVKVFLRKPGYEDLKDKQDARVAAFIEAALAVPDWLDWQLILEGQETFLKYSTSSAMGLLYYSLIGGFSAPKIIAVLDKTGYLSKGSRDNTYRRLNETMEMVVDCLDDDDAMIRGSGRGWHSVLKVRLLHARVRYRILLGSQTQTQTQTQGQGQSGPRSSNSSGSGSGDYDTSTNRVSGAWDSDLYGVPINQEDMVGTLLSFSINVIETIERIGAPFLTQREREAYIHLWRYIGYLIGVECRYNPCTSVNRARGAVESIVLHLLHPDARSMAVAKHVISAVSYRAPLEWSPNMHAQMARGLLGASLANALDLPDNTDSPLVQLYAMWVYFCLWVCALFLPWVIRRDRPAAYAGARRRLRFLVNLTLGKGGGGGARYPPDGGTGGYSYPPGEGEEEEAKTRGTVVSPPGAGAAGGGCPFGFTADSGVKAPHPVFT